MSAQFTVAIIVGSLRKESFSLKVAKALAKLAPASLKLDVVTLHDLSFYNQDFDANPPADWVTFRDRVKAADGVLFITPEYNRGPSGVLKNAIDIGSRPYGQSVFNGKPTGIISSAPSSLGGVSAAMQLRQILPGITGPILQQPEVFLTNVGDGFDDEGELKNDGLRDVLNQYLTAYAAWVARFAG